MAESDGLFVPQAPWNREPEVFSGVRVLRPNSTGCHVITPSLLTALLLSLTLISASAAVAQTPTKRAIVPTDLYRLKNLGSPEISPDGKWVAYTVSTADSAKDKNNTDVWMTAWDGNRTIRLTSSADDEHSPKWSPDGRYLSFLSGRQGGENGAQLWLLDRAGGEAEKVTDVKGGLADYDWAPDGKRLVFVQEDPDTSKADTTKSAKPIVIDRWAFKQDGTGYLTKKRSHLYLFDLPTRKVNQLTSGEYDDAAPAWSPDGRWIAFGSKRGPDADRSDNWDLFVVEPHVGAELKRLTTFPGQDAAPGGGRHPSWSADSRMIAYSQGGDPAFWAYNNVRVAVVPVDGKSPRVLTEALDRQVFSPQWGPDGKSIYGLLEDDRTVQLARVTLENGVERLTSGPETLSELAVGTEGKIAAIVSSDLEPEEVVVFENGRLRRLTHHNDSVAAELQLVKAEDLTSTSKDGTIVNALLYRPAGAKPGEKLPLVLFIHGGPFGQDQHEFSLRHQVFAAKGFAVLSVNYRGSSGRGEAYSRAIFADWGNREVMDLLGSVDKTVAMGVADPNRMALGGWSYGGILTDYTIATDTRFKAGVAGAGSANQLTMYGTDQYVFQYEHELGSPWKNPDAWIKVSYPFFHADRIKTPTLYMGGDKDMNVPITGGEQMYQALKTLGIETQLVIYPGMYHSATTPSFRRDIMERYVAWWSKYLKPMVP